MVELVETTKAKRSEESLGIIFGVLAYVMWGAFPLYWPLLDKAGAFEILAHRMLWSLVTMAVVITVIRRWDVVRGIVVNKRQLGLLSVGAVAISVNWGTYIWAVNNGHTVEAALGYFINPLVTMLMGVAFLRERLRPLQWVALGIGAVAVVVIAVDYGKLPWVALVLAFSFGSYGLLKKQANAPALESLTVESGVIGPLALVYLVVLQATGNGHFTSLGAGHTVFFVLSGVVTALPLVCFGVAATRVPMVTIGLLQYLAPIFQFVLGVAVQHEHMTSARWIGFVVVWAALVLFTVEAVHHSRNRRVEQGFVAGETAEPSPGERPAVEA